ncbi:MAG TPA: cytochrome P450, partial [Noviherbaspirillum sp.]
VMSSANHDERHFTDADMVDIRRDNASDHLTFGYGAHQCMGKNLARMELQIFLEELTKRLPHMRLAEQRFSYVPNTSFRGPEHLWVEWDPQANPERQDPALLRATSPVRIGETSHHVLGRTVRVESVTMVAQDIARLRLVALDGRAMPRWTPGSHIDIECGAPELSRQYSLCGDPADGNALEIAVLRDPESRGGSSWVHANVREGDLLKIRGPRNHFRFDESAGKVIFIAGGIGITPILAMARRARELGMDYALYYAGRSRTTMAFINELATLHGKRLYLYCKDEGARLDLQALLAAPQPDTQVYACGPVRMLDALLQACAGWPEDALRIEHFHASTSALDPAKEHAFEVELKDSGLTLTVAPDQTLLTALRAANIDVQSDCCEGLCGSCEVRVLSGAVDHRDVVLTRAEREANNKMMACCSRAAGVKIVLEL